MDAEYIQAYQTLARDHWWWRARRQMLLERLMARMDDDGWGKILDIGCGTGVITEKLTAFGEVEAVEPRSELVDPGLKEQIKLHEEEFGPDFSGEGRFDLILILDVLEHVPEPRSFLTRAVELLTEEGTLVVTVPAFELLWTSHDDLNDHVTRYTRTEFRRLAARTPLVVDEAQYFFHWPFPIKLAQRLLEQVARPEPSPPSIPADGLNELLYRVSRWEQRILTPRNLPFGTSLLALGTR